MFLQRVDTDDVPRHADPFVIALGQAQRSLPGGRPRADTAVPPGAVAHRVSVAMATL